MAEFRRMLLLVISAAGLLSVSGTGITEKYVCPGDTVEAFQNIDFDRCNSLISLNVNGKRNTEIATWLWRNCTLNATRLDAYKDRLFLDLNGTITIHNLHHFDQGKYVVISRKDTLPIIKEVQLNVMVAPSKDCKPMIVRLGNKLLASLKDSDCGTPVATLYWKGYGGVSDTNEAMLKITPGAESRTYNVCIQGPALQCAKSQMPPYTCSPFTIEGNTSHTMSPESSSTVGFIVMGTFLSLSIVMNVILILILIRRRRCTLNGKHTAGWLDDGGKQFDEVNAEHDKMIQLCDKHSDNLRSPSNDQQQSLETRRDSDHEMNEVGPERPSDIDPDTIRELQELRDAALCKICFANKTRVLFMPCNHVATCDKCSIPLHNCPVCRTTIRERKRIYFDSDE